MNHCEACKTLCLPYRRYSEDALRKMNASFRSGILLFCNDFGFTSDAKVPIISFCEWLVHIIRYLENVNEKAKAYRITIRELAEFIEEEKIEDCCFMNLIKNMDMEKSSKSLSYLCTRLVIVKNFLLKESHKYATIGQMITASVYDVDYSDEDAPDDDSHYNIVKSFRMKT